MTMSKTLQDRIRSMDSLTSPSEMAAALRAARRGPAGGRPGGGSSNAGKSGNGSGNEGKPNISRDSATHATPPTALPSRGSRLNGESSVPRHTTRPAYGGEYGHGGGGRKGGEGGWGGGGGGREKARESSARDDGARLTGDGTAETYMPQGREGGRGAAPPSSRQGGRGGSGRSSGVGNGADSCERQMSISSGCSEVESVGVVSEPALPPIRDLSPLSARRALSTCSSSAFRTYVTARFQDAQSLGLSRAPPAAELMLPPAVGDGGGSGSKSRSGTAQLLPRLVMSRTGAHEGSREDGARRLSLDVCALRQPAAEGGRESGNGGSGGGDDEMRATVFRGDELAAKSGRFTGHMAAIRRLQSTTRDDLVASLLSDGNWPVGLAMDDRGKLDQFVTLFPSYNPRTRGAPPALQSYRGSPSSPSSLSASLLAGIPVFAVSAAVQGGGKGRWDGYSNESSLLNYYVFMQMLFLDVFWASLASMVQSSSASAASSSVIPPHDAPNDGCRSPATPGTPRNLRAGSRSPLFPPLSPRASYDPSPPSPNLSVSAAASAAALAPSGPALQRASTLVPRSSCLGSLANAARGEGECNRRQQLARRWVAMCPAGSEAVEEVIEIVSRVITRLRADVILEAAGSGGGGGSGRRGYGASGEDGRLREEREAETIRQIHKLGCEDLDRLLWGLELGRSGRESQRRSQDSDEAVPKEASLVAGRIVSALIEGANGGRSLQGNPREAEGAGGSASAATGAGSRRESLMGSLPAPPRLAGSLTRNPSQRDLKSSSFLALAIGAGGEGKDGIAQRENWGVGGSGGSGAVGGSRSGRLHGQAAERARDDARTPGEAREAADRNGRSASHVRVGGDWGKADGPGSSGGERRRDDRQEEEEERRRDRDGAGDRRRGVDRGSAGGERGAAEGIGESAESGSIRSREERRQAEREERKEAEREAEKDERQRQQQQQQQQQGRREDYAGRQSFDSSRRFQKTLFGGVGGDTGAGGAGGRGGAALSHLRSLSPLRSASPHRHASPASPYRPPLTAPMSPYRAPQSALPPPPMSPRSPMAGGDSSARAALDGGSSGREQRWQQMAHQELSKLSPGRFPPVSPRACDLPPPGSPFRQSSPHSPAPQSPHAAPVTPRALPAPRSPSPHEPVTPRAPLSPRSPNYMAISPLASTPPSPYAPMSPYGRSARGGVSPASPGTTLAPNLAPLKLPPGRSSPLQQQQQEPSSPFSAERSSTEQQRHGSRSNASQWEAGSHHEFGMPEPTTPTGATSAARAASSAAAAAASGAVPGSPVPHYQAGIFPRHPGVSGGGYRSPITTGGPVPATSQSSQDQRNASPSRRTPTPAAAATVSPQTGESKSSSIYRSSPTRHERFKMLFHKADEKPAPRPSPRYTPSQAPQPAQQHAPVRDGAIPRCMIPPRETLAKADSNSGHPSPLLLPTVPPPRSPSPHCASPYSKSPQPRRYHHLPSAQAPASPLCPAPPNLPEFEPLDALGYSREMLTTPTSPFQKGYLGDVCNFSTPRSPLLASAPSKYPEQLSRGDDSGGEGKLSAFTRRKAPASPLAGPLGWGNGATQPVDAADRAGEGSRSTSKVEADGQAGRPASPINRSSQRSWRQLVPSLGKIRGVSPRRMADPDEIPPFEPNVKFQQVQQWLWSQPDNLGNVEEEEEQWKSQERTAETSEASQTSPGELPEVTSTRGGGHRGVHDAGDRRRRGLDMPHGAFDVDERENDFAHGVHRAAAINSSKVMQDRANYGALSPGASPREETGGGWKKVIGLGTANRSPERFRKSGSGRLETMPDNNRVTENKAEQYRLFRGASPLRAVLRRGAS